MTCSSFVEENKICDIENGERAGIPPRRHTSSQQLWVEQCDLEQDGDNKKKDSDGQAEESSINNNVDSEILIPRKQVSIRSVKFNASATRSGDGNEGEKKGRPRLGNDKMLKKSQSYRKIVVRQNEAPSKRLVLRMMELQDELNHVTERITSGLNV